MHVEKQRIVYTGKHRIWVRLILWGLDTRDWHICFHTIFLISETNQEQLSKETIIL